MMRTLLRAPSGAAEAVADGLRVLALLGIVVAGLAWGTIAGVSLAVVSVGMFLPRLLDVRPSVDITFGVVVLLAVWSSVLYVDTIGDLVWGGAGALLAGFTVSFLRGRSVEEGALPH